MLHHLAIFSILEDFMSYMFADLCRNKVGWSMSSIENIILFWSQKYTSSHSHTSHCPNNSDAKILCCNIIKTIWKYLTSWVVSSLIAWREVIFWGCQTFRAEESNHGRIKVFRKITMHNQALLTGLSGVTKCCITASKFPYSNLVFLWLLIKQETS